MGFFYIMMNIKLLLLTIGFFITGTVFSQKIECGNYIAYNGGLVSKYTILNVYEDSAAMEVYTKWQGEWLPAIGKWDNTYKPQILIQVLPGTLEVSH